MPDRRRHLRPNPNTLGVEELSDGEVTRVVRVRGPAAAVDAFAALTAAERGVIVARVMP
jgi:hypothetical protein